MDSLKEKLKCAKCGNVYGETIPMYINKKCEHHFCEDCCSETCSVCNSETDFVKFPMISDVITAINEHTEIVKKSTEIEKELEQKSVEAEKKKEERNQLEKEKQQMMEIRKEQHACFECENVDFEQHMHLCGVCHELKFSNEEEVKKNALCSTCAIKKHIRQGHKIVDFYPFLSLYQFSSHRPNIKSKLEEFDNLRGVLKKSCFNFDVLTIKASEYYNVLTDMARRSKSTKIQVEFFEKIESFIEESKSITIDADSEVKKRIVSLQENLEAIREWHKSKLENCVDDSETVKLEEAADSNNNDVEIETELAFAQNFF
ncbi:unnamed protein product [Caenorhabditis angaria]|uniref:RING-type domain-containing protein n=1 Tax=Caenorhabditis angaria TaxID=860376 RepID=A0A9P1ID66_9PELO|nr:unnamed protein product [Caenorhabditis angaria]